MDEVNSVKGQVVPDDTSLVLSDMGEVAAPETGEGDTLKPKQSQEENALFAKMRRDAEEKARVRYEGFEEMLEAVGQFGFEGRPMEIAKAIKEMGISAENLPQVLEAKKIILERKLENDLKAIKSAYPDVKASSVNELGDVYLKLMKSDDMNPVVAYEAQVAFNNRTVKPVPPSAGTAKSGGVDAEKEFFTQDEVDRLTDKQLSDPKIFERVRRSMTKWK